MLVDVLLATALASHSGAALLRALSRWSSRPNAVLNQYYMKIFLNNAEGISIAPVGCVKNLALEKANRGDAATDWAYLKRDIAAFIGISSGGQIGCVLKSAFIWGTK